MQLSTYGYGLSTMHLGVIPVMYSFKTQPFVLCIFPPAVLQERDLWRQIQTAA